ncbi:GAF domain-containing protein [Ramlibacter sp. G-1-2-2]|uniref:GAF domain-containing protein n=1 Tax=Ramlibacter agri TaxID=2728837 RepID=A0A848H0H0_9BURK|nr:GAF domain-containing protein [Ramlibacter agri]NML44456.1 GAF domain-containing protein [Ramlibacter agri]
MESKKVWSETAKLVEAAGREAPLARVLSEVVSAARAITSEGCRAALYLHDLGAACLNLGVNGGLPQGYVDAVQGFKVAEEQPACGRVAYLGAEDIVPEIRLDARWQPYSGLADAHAIQACWSFPLLSEIGVLGTLAVYHEVPTAPTSAQAETLRYLATIAAAAVERSRRESVYQDELKQLPVTADFSPSGRRSGTGSESIMAYMRTNSAGRST